MCRRYIPAERVLPKRDSLLVGELHYESVVGLRISDDCVELHLSDGKVIPFDRGELVPVYRNE